MRQFSQFKRMLHLTVMLALLAVLVPAAGAQDAAGVQRVTLAATPFAEGAGLAAVTGDAYIDSAAGLIYITLNPNGAALPAGAVLEGWVVDAGLDGGPGTTNVSDADQMYGVPFGDANLDAFVSSAPYALSTGVLTPDEGGLWSAFFAVPNYNFSPYDAVVITLESDGNVDPWDPRPGTPVLIGMLADAQADTMLDLGAMLAEMGMDGDDMMGDMAGLEVALAPTPLAEGAGLAGVTGVAQVYSADAHLSITVNLNGAALPAGAVLEGWIVDAGLAGGPGVTNAADSDEAFGTPFGDANFDSAVEQAPYALSTGVLAGSGDALTLSFDVPGYNFGPYDAVVITLESDGNAAGFDPRPGTPVLAGLLANGTALAPMAAVDAPDWQTLPLTNARTGETFTLADLAAAGQRVLVEPMATWCSNCARQQGNVKVAKDGVDANAYTFISLSVETNISQDALASYADGRGFDWVFVVASPELLSALTAEFGNTINNPPSTPHFVVYPDGSWSALITGYTAPDALLALLNR